MSNLIDRAPQYILDKVTAGKNQITHERVAHQIEIEGVSIQYVSSNVRHPDIKWEEMGLTPGIGREGNLVAVQALGSIGFRTSIEDQSGADRTIDPGDKFIAVLANRLSGTSESGYVPEEGLDINKNTILDLLAAGGIVGFNTGVPGRIKQETLKLKSLGLVAQNGRPLDLIELCGGHHESLNPSAPIIVVCGTSAEVGKTTTAAGLIRALREDGIRVAGTKFAGTGRLRDIISLHKAGAHPWLDFADVGLPTTYTSQARFEKGIYTLFNHINAGQPEIIIAEAGGDPIEANIPEFLRNPVFMNNVKAIVGVAGDVLGMMGMVAHLRQFVAPNFPIYLTDPKDRNSVTTRDRVNRYLGLPIFNSLDPQESKAISTQIMQFK